MSLRILQNLGNSCQLYISDRCKDAGPYYIVPAESRWVLKDDCRPLQAQSNNCPY